MKQQTNGRLPSIWAKRKPGVPSRQQMYEILKARSLQIQSGDETALIPPTGDIIELIGVITKNQ